MGRSSGGIGLFVSPEDREKLVETLRTQRRVEDVELRFRKKSGEIVTMLGSAELILFAGEAHLLCMMLDITARKRAEEARRASEDLYHAVFEHSLAALAIIEEDGTISLANTQLSKALGYSREEIEGKMDWTGLLVPEDLGRLEACHRARAMNPDSAPMQYECRVRRKDGTVMYGLIRVGMIPGTKRTIFSGMEVAGAAAGTLLHSVRPHSSDRLVSLSGRLGERGKMKSPDIPVCIPDPHEGNGISS